MESPFLGMDEGRFSHGTPNFGDWWGNLRGEPLIFIVWGTFGCVWETGGGIFARNRKDPAPTVGADAAILRLQGVARRFLTATGRMPPRTRIWAMRQRGAARHAATNATAPIDTQGFACSGWGFSAAGAWRGCAVDKNAIPRIGGRLGDPKPNFARPARPEPNAEASLWAAGWPRRASAM